MNINDFEMLEPMKYYDNPEPKTAGATRKRQDMVDNKNNLYIATEKNDGDWGMFIHYTKGQNLIRSRSLSKVTGKYGDLTEKLPHLVAEMDNWPDNTVILAEICWGEYGTNCNTVGTILRCLPPKAVERQKDKKLVGKIFDVLMMNGIDYTNYPYLERISGLATALVCEAEEQNTPLKYFSITNIYYDNFAEEADNIISQGGEGLVIQLKSNSYMSDTRTAWKTLKLKQALPHMDLKVISTLEPTKEYNGECGGNWPYKDENGVLVTKPYFMKWKNGVVVDFNGVAVSVTSGLTDEDREWLATEEAQISIIKGEVYAEVKAMSVNDLGSLRHPALVRLRTDMVDVNE